MDLPEFFQQNQYKATNIKANKLDIDFYECLFSNESAQLIYQTLEKEVQWSSSITQKKRSNQTYGDSGLVYEIKFGGYGGKPINLVKRKVIPWEDFPLLIKIRDYVSFLTGEKYNFCVIQRYPNGKVGINPHKDKEMKKGTIISGLSFGSARTLTMNPPSFIKDQPIKIDLGIGSLYVFKGSTNDYWTHCIEKSDCDIPRISLTFRNVPNSSC